MRPLKWRSDDVNNGTSYPRGIPYTLSATSFDGGKTWDANWIMEFQRVQPP